MKRILALALFATTTLAMPALATSEPVREPGLAETPCVGEPMGERLMPGDKDALSRCAAQYVRSRITNESVASRATAERLRDILRERSDLAIRRLLGANCETQAVRIRQTAEVLMVMTTADQPVNSMGPWWTAMSAHLMSLHDGDACLAR